MCKRISIIVVFIAAILLVISLPIFHVLAQAVDKELGENIIKPQEAKKIAEDMVNTYLIQDKNADFSGELEEKSGLYKVNFTIDDAERPVYLTMDGKFLILPNGMVNIAELKKKDTDKKEQAAIVTKNVPMVELYIMSLCPYGVKAEKEILPVIKDFGEDIDFKIKYIVDVTGETIADINSLHGPDEVFENLRQAAIMRHYPQKFPLYLNMIEEKSCLISCGEVSLDTYWKEAAEKLKIDPKKIESFVKGKEGINFLRESNSDSKKYNITASPTLIINGVRSQAIYEGPEAIKTSICSSFVTPPEDCIRQTY